MTLLVPLFVVVFLMRADGLRSRHFAFRGAELSLLALARCGVSTFPLQSRRSLHVFRSNHQRFFNVIFGFNLKGVIQEVNNV